MTMTIRASLTPLAALSLVSAVALWSGACSGCEESNNINQSGAGDLLVSPNRVSFPQVNVGSFEEQAVTLRNVSSDPLTITSIRLAPRDGGSINDLSVQGLPSTPFRIEGQSAQEFLIRYAPTSVVGDKGQLLIGSSDPKYSSGPYSLPIDTLDSRPQLSVAPESVRFAKLPIGAEVVRQVTLTNIGSAPLIIHEQPGYDGGADFTVTWPNRTYPLTLDVCDLEQAERSPERCALVGAVRYRPIGDGADSGEVVIVSNDNRDASPEDPTRGRRRVSVAANSEAPCIFVDSTARNLGQTPVGTTVRDVVQVQNCGQETLSISEIRVTQNSNDDEFELELGSWDQDGDGRLDTNVELAPGAQGTFTLKYIPATEGADQGKITIFSNDPVQPALELTAVGRGANGICPTALGQGFIRGSGASPRETISAVPLQYLILDGSRSTDEDGRVVQYEWVLKSKPREDPTPRSPLPPTREDVADMDKSRREVRLLLSGEYIFELTVKDNDGFESCNKAEVRVVTIPNEKISVELTWINPEDPNEADNIGADVDLHLVKMGPGSWFEAPYDIYFRNANNGIGSENNGLWNPESPSLDIDDTDGAGPETIQMNDPAPCQWYAIGVHYYKQLFGTAYARIRVYIDTRLVYESTKALRRGGQFWDVARIHWDSRLVFDVDNLLPAAPQGMNPEVTREMVESGQCTTQNLY